MNGFLESDLRMAAFRGDYEKIKYLIQRGVNVDAPGKDGVTPLMIAAGRNKMSAVRLLLRLGADASKQDKWLMNALMHAIRNASKEAAEHLIDATKKIDAWDFDGKTALIHAVIIDMPAVVAKLVARGANVDYTDNLNRTPFMYAVKLGRQEIFHILEPVSDYPVEAMQMFYPKGCYLMGHAAILLTYKSGISRQYDFHDHRMHDKHRIAAKEVLGINSESALWRITLNKENTQILRNRVIKSDFSKAVGLWDVDKFTRSIGYKRLSPKEGALMAWKGEDMAIYSGCYNFYGLSNGNNCVTSGQSILDAAKKRFSKKITPGGVYNDGLKLSAKRPDLVFTDSIAKPFGIFRENELTRV